MKLSESLIIMAEWWIIPITNIKDLRKLDEEFGKEFFDAQNAHIDKKYLDSQFNGILRGTQADYEAQAYLCLLEAQYQKDIEEMEDIEEINWQKVINPTDLFFY